MGWATFTTCSVLVSKSIRAYSVTPERHSREIVCPFVTVRSSLGGVSDPIRSRKPDQSPSLGHGRLEDIPKGPRQLQYAVRLLEPASLGPLPAPHHIRLGVARGEQHLHLGLYRLHYLH